MIKLLHPLLLCLTLLVACTPVAEDPVMVVYVVVDGRNLTYDVSEPITVGEFLDQIEVSLGELDAVSPQLFTQVSDGIQITVRRISEETYCEDNEIPYERRTLIDERLEAGAEVLFEPGQNGLERQCFRVQVVDGIRAAPVAVGAATIITSPRPEVVYVGPTTTLDPVEVRGTLAYISGGNAWVMRGSSDTRHPVTNTSDLDPLRAFSLSPDGRQLLITRITTEDSTFGNQLHLIPDVNAAQPEVLPLLPTNILWADWVPGRTNTLSYTRAEPRPTSPGWGAFNDLWLMTIDPSTGEEVVITPLIEESPGRGGPFSWWGRSYAWSPDGSQLAWVHADGVGTVNLDSGELNPPLAQYEVFSPRSDWSWRTTVSWSPDNSLMTAVIHGPPVGSESPERSPVFDVALMDTTGAFSATVVDQAGIWALPKFSPTLNSPDGLATGYLAYLKARQPLVSVGDSAEYDLVIADFDGSNARILFPAEGQRGITQRDYAWSPDGTQIAAVYQGNIWVIDVISGVASQVTLDGGAQSPVWMP
ncbi:MAG: G5 domain-containing protein [Anaerolineae bacterium]|jgi:hypothetical protein|nr:G5 domain-containing protein [Anaerolineae bacterium]